MIGSIGKKGGIPVKRLERKGMIIPPKAPYIGPHSNPIRNTGICIGNNTVPGIPKACAVK